MPASARYLLRAVGDADVHAGLAIATRLTLLHGRGALAVPGFLPIARSMIWSIVRRLISGAISSSIGQRLAQPRQRTPGGPSPLARHGTLVVSAFRQVP